VGKQKHSVRAARTESVGTAGACCHAEREKASEEAGVVAFRFSNGKIHSSVFLGPLKVAVLIANTNIK